MDNFLILEFKDAGFFRTTTRTKDKIMNITGKVDRVTMSEFKEPITKHQISNLLHVLFGERPVPSLRPSSYDKIDYYVAKSEECFLKIDSYRKFDDRKKEYDYIPEFIQMNKQSYNAWSKVRALYWDRIEKMLGVELFNEFYAILKTELKIDRNDHTFEDTIELINKSDNKILNDFLVMLSKNKNSSLVFDIKNHIGNTMNQTYSRGTALTEPRGTDSIRRISGSILVPISNDDILKLRSNNGCGTLLDGGFVKIKGIRSFNSQSTLGYTKMSEISDEFIVKK